VARLTVVNDSEEFLGVMSEVIREAGHRCTALKGETVTLDDIAASDPELLIIDLRLETGVLNDGWSIVVGARAHPRLADVPIIICSGDLQFMRERADEIAALADVHSLAKPFRLAEVEDLVKRLLERQPHASAGSA